jgi:hypothetical protein
MMKALFCQAEEKGAHSAKEDFPMADFAVRFMPF